MKKYLLLGLILLGLTAMASDEKVSEENNISKSEDNKTKEPKDKKKKILIVDLDKEKKEDGLKGGNSNQPLRASILLGHNDEVSIIGKDIFTATPVRLYINGKFYAKISNPNHGFKLKKSILKIGDIITIKNRFVTLVEKKVEK